MDKHRPNQLDKLDYHAVLPSYTSILRARDGPRCTFGRRAARGHPALLSTLVLFTRQDVTMCLTLAMTRTLLGRGTGSDVAVATCGGQGKCAQDEPPALLRALGCRQEDAHHGSPPRGKCAWGAGRGRLCSRYFCMLVRMQPEWSVSVRCGGAGLNAPRSPRLTKKPCRTQIYGPGVEKLKVDVRPFKFKSQEVEVTFLSSNYHIELNPSDVGPYRDRDVAQEVIKEIAQSHAPSTAAGGLFKVIVLNEVDKMSRDGQAALRRTMEKYTSACRFIMVCNNACKVIEPLRSRCICLRIAAPPVDHIAPLLMNVYKREVKGKELPRSVAERIATVSNRNVRKALLMLESCYVRHGHLEEGIEPAMADWEVFVGVIATNIIGEQTPKRLLDVRAQFYDLLAGCIPPEMIIQRLTVELLKKLDDEVKAPVLQEAARFEHRLQMGSKPIFHLEAFAAKVMAIYKKWQMELDELCAAAMDE